MFRPLSRAHSNTRAHPSGLNEAETRFIFLPSVSSARRCLGTKALPLPSDRNSQPSWLTASTPFPYPSGSNVALCRGLSELSPKGGLSGGQPARFIRRVHDRSGASALIL